MDLVARIIASARKAEENFVGVGERARRRWPGDSRSAQTHLSDARGSGFTLIELLVCVAVLTILISIMLPGLSAAREQSRLTACAGNLHSLGQGIAVFASQNDQKLPPRPKQITSLPTWYYPTDFFQQHNWHPTVFGQIYGANYPTKLFACPANSTTEIRAQQTIVQDGVNRKIPWGYQYYGATTNLVHPPWAPRFLGDVYDGPLSVTNGVKRIDQVTIRQEEASNMPLMSDLTMRSKYFKDGVVSVFSNHDKSGQGDRFLGLSNSLLSDGSVVKRMVSDQDTPFLFHDTGQTSSNYWLYYYR